ncbi:MAG: hypothetical protein JWP65_3735 [Ramlibacter sp.]|jgi:hypothetical protein|uniref:hypothetical protein n=1 Tax=Ramlibacter sp. TaxID=1917967 RepID=UPI002609A8AB|nr:hypothetical protein [Ramlibacter sp.]MDB5753314.1 hypothetical protein [Ramlibacter sp.]
MAQSTPAGATPPTPNLDREEPDFWIEDDIPSDDGGPADRPASSPGQPERSHPPERE